MLSPIYEAETTPYPHTLLYTHMRYEIQRKATLEQWLEEWEEVEPCVGEVKGAC